MSPMTMRDHFAMAAMQTLISNDFDPFPSKEALAWEAYEYADAMLRMKDARIAVTPKERCMSQEIGGKSVIHD